MTDREEFEKWADGRYALGAPGEKQAHQEAWFVWQAARRTTPDRDSIIEECAKIAERTYAKDAFHFELGTAAARAIRALKTAPNGEKG